MTVPAARSTADRKAADRQAAVDAYASGQQRLIEIAAAYQVTSKTVLEWVRQAGRPLRGSAAQAPHAHGLDLDTRRSPDGLPAADPQHRPDPQDHVDAQPYADPQRYVDPQRAAAVAAYLSGTGVQEIVQTLGVPRATVVAWLRAAGVPLRPADGGSPHADPAPAMTPVPAEAATSDVAGQPDPPPEAASTGEVALVQATAERGRIALRWEAREPDVRQFHVEVSRADKKDWRTVGTTDAGQTTLEWRKAKKGKEYRFRVRATTTAGPGPWSRPVKVAAR